MAVLPIRVFPDPVLKEIARPVDRVDDAVRRVLDDHAIFRLDAEPAGGAPGARPEVVLAPPGARGRT